MRNPIARVVTRIRPQVVADRRRALREKALDDMVRESERLGLYDNNKSMENAEATKVSELP